MTQPLRPSRLRRRLLAVLAALALTMLGFGVVPSTASAATQVPCHDNHHKKNGFSEHDCGWYTKASVYEGPHGFQRKVGTIHGGTNWVLCQAVGKTVHSGKYYNKYWAYTLTDQGTWGWVNAVYASGGSNNGSFKGVPTCGRHRYDGNFYPDLPPQTAKASGGRLSCEVYADPFAEVWAASCQRFTLSPSGSSITHGYSSSHSTVACDLETRTYHGRRICEITGEY